MECWAWDTTHVSQLTATLFAIETLRLKLPGPHNKFTNFGRSYVDPAEWINEPGILKALESSKEHAKDPSRVSRLLMIVQSR